MQTNYYEILKKAFKPLLLTEDNYAHFFNGWEEVSFNKNEVITDRDSIEHYFYVVISGVQAIYVIAKNGDKQILGFSFDGSFSGAYDSFLYQTPSVCFVESITPSKLLRMNKQHYDSLFEVYPEFERWGRITHQNLLIGRVQREVELITLSSKERFDLFMARCPQLLLQIPQKYLAWYLNMTPETYSRLRSKIS